MLRARVGFVGLAALLLALSACGSGAGKGDAGQTGGEGGTAGNACSSCNYAAQYCYVTVGGAVGSQPSYVCRDLPASCGSNRTCACLMGSTGCGNLCSQADGGITVTCQAP